YDMPLEIRCYSAIPPCLITFTTFFVRATAASETYTLSLHDALPICCRAHRGGARSNPCRPAGADAGCTARAARAARQAAVRSCRSEEHTSELQSRENLVCRLLLEKKKIAQAIIDRKLRITEQELFVI